MCCVEHSSAGQNYQARYVQSVLSNQSQQGLDKATDCGYSTGLGIECQYHFVLCQCMDILCFVMVVGDHRKHADADEHETERDREGFVVRQNADNN